MPFGICCASDAAQEMIECHFGDISGVLAIHDDIIIVAENENEHDIILQKILQRARERNIKFNLKKIQFRIPQVRYLGNIVSNTRLQLDPIKINPITNMPTPTTEVELQRFLGMVNYLRQFIPNISEITTPLRSLLKKETLWAWAWSWSMSLPRRSSCQLLFKESYTGRKLLRTN